MNFIFTNSSVSLSLFQMRVISQRYCLGDVYVMPPSVNIFSNKASFGLTVFVDQTLLSSFVVTISYMQCRDVLLDLHRNEW